VNLKRKAWRNEKENRHNQQKEKLHKNSAGRCRMTKSENNPYTKFHNHGHRAWKNKVIPTPIKIIEAPT